MKDMTIQDIMQEFNNDELLERKIKTYDDYVIEARRIHNDEIDIQVRRR